MDEKARKAEFDEIFADVDEKERNLVDKLIDEVVFLEVRMEELKKLPFVSVNPRNNAMQKVTAAAREYKNCSQSYMNAIRILYSVLKKVESDAQNELLKRLEEFV